MGEVGRGEVGAEEGTWGVVGEMGNGRELTPEAAVPWNDHVLPLS